MGWMGGQTNSGLAPDDRERCVAESTHVSLMRAFDLSA
jgi:hypothetical protein